MAGCSVCNAANAEELEAFGLSAQAEEMSWREAARQAGLKYHQPLKTHMEKHYVPRAEKEVRDEMAVLVEDACAELAQQMRMAPVEVKPLYAAAIHNLKQLPATKPSQQHLIMALKTIQELTGMKQEQRLMLQFADAMFRELPGPVKAIENVVDAEVVG